MHSQQNTKFINNFEKKNHILLIICKSSGQYAVLHSCIRRNRKQMYEKELHLFFLSPNIVLRLRGRDELVATCHLHWEIRTSGRKHFNKNFVRKNKM